MGLGPGVRPTLGMRADVAATILVGTDGLVGPSLPYVLLHLLVAAPRLREILVWHLPETNISEPLDSMVIHSINHEQIHSLQVTKEV